ncbi:polyhydroxyalkanoic acid system family protein [Marilutibacter aestuarii]|uniref:Polyhydroxyalkanoic acid synthase n=1 Tax=Marilutibacter aestuarii TaxID=1706195 RepID=A0A508APV5_9GAMM|nr:polyhydroxyalkanoic acid system family protein [Lysobacter aestuarii]TQD49768.1 polyhydroxyalkanoic acid synthase [Lysobacter aestuarii]
MPSIDIRHAHSLSPDQARQAVEEVAGKLSERFGVACEWCGDRVDFNTSGVQGRIALEPGQVHVTAQLGLLMSAFKGPIETEIRRVLAERFV